MYVYKSSWERLEVCITERRYSTKGINEVSREDPCYCFSLIKAMKMVQGRLKGHIHKTQGSR